MKKLTLLFLAVLFAVMSWSQDMIQIGTGTSGSTNFLGGSYGHERSAVLYTQSELAAKGMLGGVDLTQIALQVSTMTSTPSGTRTIKIWVKEVTQTTLTSSMFSDWADLCASADLVYDNSGSNISITTNSWNDFVFLMPYSYNGGNLLIFTDCIGTSASGGNAINTYYQSAASMHWKAYKDSAYTVPLNNNNSNTNGTSGGTVDGTRINIRISFEPTILNCPVVTALAASNFTETGADISWQGSGSEYEWEIEYKKANEDWEAATVLLHIQDTLYSLQGLEPNTLYNVRVRGICGESEGEQSNWRSISFRTKCGLFTIPFTEDFSYWTTGTGVWSNACWTKYMQGNTPASYPYITALSNNNALCLYPTAILPSTAFLPLFDANGQDLALVFDLAMASSNRIDIVTTNDPQSDPSTWTQIGATIDDGIGTAAIHYKNYEYIIDNYQAGTYIGFKAHTGASTYAYIDNVFLTTCPQPKNLDVTDITQNSADYSFSAGGSETQWQYIVTPSAVTDPASANITPVNISETSGTIDNLESGTSYKLWLRSSCSADTQSPWTAGAAFTTQCFKYNLPYKDDFSSYATSSIVWFNNCWTRYTGSLAHVSGTTVFPYVASTYGQSLYFMQSNTNITAAFLPLFDAEGADVALEFDYQMATSGRLDVVTTSDPQSAPATWTVITTLSNGTGTGTTSYKHTPPVIISNYNADTYIGFKSHTAATAIYMDNLFVYQIFDNNVSPISITSSVGAGGVNLTNVDFTVAVKNEGTNTQSNVPVVLEVDGVVAGTEYIASIANGATETVTFTGVGVFAAETHTFAIRAYTDLITDQNRANDTTAVFNLKNTIVESCINTTNVQIGTGTSPHSIIHGYNYNYAQNIYLASEIDEEGGGAGVITSIAYQFNSGTFNNSSNVWTVYIGHTLKNEFANNTDWEVVGNLQEVFNGVVTSPGAGNWMTINLYTPFVWDGTSNIVVAVLENESGTSSIVNFSGSSAVNRNIYYRVDDSTPINPASPPTASGRYGTYPNIKFNMCAAPPSSCPRPTGLTVDTITDSDVELTWTAGASASQWGIEYKKVSETNWTTINNITNNTYTIQGLEALTAYNVRVKAVCDIDNESAWSSVVNFTTLCGAVSLPFTENFSTWTTEETWFHPCWERYALGYNSGKRPYVDTSGRLYFYHNSSTVAACFLPPINADGQNLLLQFDLALAVGETFNVVLSNSPQNKTTWQVLESTNNGTGSSAPSVHHEVTISNYQAGTYIGFSLEAGGSIGYVDNVVVDIASGCVRPSGIAVDNITTSSADIYWMQGNAEIEWVFEYKKASASIWQSFTVSTTYYALADLSDNTSYDVRIKGICGTEETGWLIGSFRTLADCSGVNLPFYEPFTGWATGSGNWSNPCWVRNIGTAPSTLPYITTSNNGSTQSPSGAPYLYFSSTNSDNLISSVLLPLFNVDIKPFEINFWSNKESANSGTLSIGYLTDANDFTTFTIIETFDEVLEDVWYEHTVSLNSVPSGIKNIVIKQNKITSGSYYWVDDIYVGFPITCTRPTVLAASNPAAYSVNLNWTAGDTETQWVVEYKTADETDWVHQVSATENPFVLEGLTASTSYSIRVKTDCGGGNISLPSNVVTVNTIASCNPPVVSLVSKTGTTATINWTGNAANYVIEYGKTGFARGEGTTANATESPYTITGLDALTGYEVYLHGDCGAGDLSSETKFSFTTDYLSTIVVTPENSYLEDLENATVSGANLVMSNVRWSISNDNGSTLALSIKDDANSIDGKYAYVSKGDVGRKSSLISPLFDITALTMPMFSLQHIQYAYYGVPNRSEELRVYYKAAAEDNWALVPGLEFTSIMTEWEDELVVLPSTSATYQFKFEVTGRNAMGLSMDNVRIYEGAPKVITLEATDLTTNSATLHKEVTEGIKPLLSEGFEYKKKSETNWQTSLIEEISNLTHSTVYEFRAFATTEDGKYYGETLEFSTVVSGIDNPTSESNSKVVLYPNPAKHTTTLAISGFNSAAQVFVTDLLGREIASYNLSAAQTQLDINVAGFADGTYLVRVISDNATAIQKLVVKK